jgi:hypothetical protein
VNCILEKPKVFLSYTVEDKEVATIIKTKLSQDNILVYTDEIFFDSRESITSKIRNQLMPTAAELLTALDNCPKGKTGWRQFEDLGIEILKFLFVPPLKNL